ncbi:MAG TPA: two-component regulator propeller domain-containing protein [Bacteroidia bacterium]|jgi:ligand-binding sensor domain-containing protein/serine phosphatase RsbU (regulator of sigma subunit)
MKKIHLVSLVFLLSGLILCLNPLHSQTTSFIYYGVEQGLSQSQVQDLTQDDDGNLWIGTLSGLTQYNGQQFKTFSRKDSLAEDWITAMCKDKAGNIWFGHWAGGVSMYNYKTKKIENLNLEEYTRFKTVTAIIQDADQRFWIATEGAGIFIYDPQNKKMISLNKKDGLSSDNVYDICLDQKGNIWIATDIGITIYDSKAAIGSVGSFSILNTGNGLMSNRITTLALVNYNEIWVGSADAGVMVLQVKDNFKVMLPTKTIEGAGERISTANGLGSDFINCITEDKAHNIWIGTTGGGAAKVTPFPTQSRSEAISKAIIYNYSTKQGLNYFNANAIFQDREGSIWIGTDIGLNQYRGERFQIYDEADSLVNNLVWTTLCDREGNIWLGTNEGISKITFTYSEINRKENHSIKNYTVKNGLSSNVVLSSFEDKSGDLWFGTGFGGVCKLDKATGKFECFNKSNGLAGDVVYAICDDNKGNLWFGTKEGASKFDPVLKTFRNYSIVDGLGGNNVYRIFKDAKGNLWFGALGGSLSMFDGASFKTFDEEDGMRHRFILCINEDKLHNLWFGAYGGGLYKYDGKTFTNYTVKEGLTTDSPYSIMADNDNRIWIGSSRGIDRFDEKTGKFIHYGKAEGFLGVETNPNAVCMDKVGNIWYGSIMGAVRYSPKEDKPNTVEPKTFITSIKLFMKDYEFPDDARFKYNENHLTFNFVGISLNNPEKVQYQYKLEGFDQDWLPGFTSAQEAVYSNLPPGSYTFMVRAFNNDGTGNIQAAQYKFYIAPPFWQTAVFYILVGLFAIFGLYVFDKMRTQKLKSAKKLLQEKVEERTEELAIKNSELAEKNKDITDSIRYAKRIQEAILPPEKVIKRYLPDSFVFSKPKDIVSGDFYWVNKKGDDILFAAVDCTGHGVPGAFMSIVGHNILTQAINDNIAVTPAKLLDKLNKGVSETLNQTSEDTRLRDGMDIALCSINFKTMELQYAGAYNPLIIIRNKELIEIKADSIAIGSYTETQQQTYNNHVMQLQKGDTIYVFSDGYTDQFGGAEGKKFKLAQFKTMLLTLNGAPLDQQQIALETSIDEWRGVLQQVDDMLVIGVRV